MNTMGHRMRVGAGETMKEETKYMDELSDKEMNFLERKFQTRIIRFSFDTHTHTALAFRICMFLCSNVKTSKHFLMDDCSSTLLLSVSFHDFSDRVDDSK